MPARIAIYPGSFDPITNGHVSIIERGLLLFDRLIIGLLENISKHPLFGIEERRRLVVETFKGEPRIEVDSFDGLLVDYAKSRNAIAIVRGLRGVADFEYELQMCNMNRRLAPNITTVYLMAEDRHSYVSSSLLKEVARLGGDVRGLVPPVVEKRFAELFKSPSSQ